MCEKFFPVENHSVDYLSSANTVRDDRARTVTKTVMVLQMFLLNCSKFYCPVIVRVHHTYLSLNLAVFFRCLYMQYYR